MGEVDATNGSEISCLIGSFCVGAAGGWFIAYLQDTWFCCVLIKACVLAVIINIAFAVKISNLGWKILSPTV